MPSANLFYIATDTRRMIRQRDYLRGKANKQIRNEVSYAIRKAKILAEGKGDLTKTWQTLNQAMNREVKSNSIDKLNVKGGKTYDKMKIAESCKEYFTDIGKKLASKISLSDTNINEYVKTITHAKFKFKHITPFRSIKL